MKKRTLEELHDSKIGHKKFAKVCDLLIKQGYSVSDIKEYYEKFVFVVDDKGFDYPKEWKSSSKAFVDYVLDMIKTIKQVKQLHYGR